MFNAKSELPEDIKSFLDLVVNRTKGYDVYLGGGYLRDIWWNLNNPDNDTPKTPKDLDLFFIPNREIVKELPVIPKTYINYDIPAVDIPNVRENVKHVRGIFAKHLSTSDVQFIVYDKYLTIEELAADMDTSINQIMYSPEITLSYGTNNFFRDHENKIIEMLHDFEPERMVARIKRMHKKFPDYELRHKLGEELFDKLYTKLKKNKQTLKSGPSFRGSFIADSLED